MKKNPEPKKLPMGLCAPPTQRQRTTLLPSLTNTLFALPPPALPSLASLVVIPCLPSAIRRSSLRWLILAAIVLSTYWQSSAQGCASTTGYNPGSSFSTSSHSGSLFNWANAGLARSTTDGGVASATLTLSLLNPGGHSNYLTAQGFGFNIPNGATICAINVEVVKFASGISVLSSVTDNSIKLLNNGTPTGSNLASGASWAGSSETVTYSASGASWTTAQVNSPSFGVAIAASVGGVLGVALTANIDRIRMSITYDMSTVLANTLQQFSVTRASDGNLLTWTASAALSGTRYTVQRSPDTHSWSDLATIGGPNAVSYTTIDAGGESISSATDGTTNYRYTDPTAPNGPSFYRLQLQNSDGKTTFSTVVGINGNTAITQVRCYPNPFLDLIHITSPHPLHHIRLTDLQGRTLQTQEFTDAVYSTQLSVPDLPAGFYFVQVDSETFRVVKKSN